MDDIEKTPEQEQEVNNTPEEVEADKDSTSAYNNDPALLAEVTKLKAIVMRHKEKEGKEKETPKESKSTPEISRDEVVLLAKGYTEEKIEMAKKVASISGVKLSEAINDPIYKTWEETKAKEEKEQKSQLGATKGSGSGVAKKGFNTPGLSDKERKELWKQKYGS